MIKDGCSGGMSRFWRWAFGKPPPWEGCCHDHDLLYASGGPRYLRRIADRRLYACVRAGGHPAWALSMFLAVRVFGGPAWPTPWRWGFEQEYGQGYTDIGA